MQKITNLSEELVERCCAQRESQVKAIRANRYRSLDSEGVDFLIFFAIRGNHFGSKYFPLPLTLQVKTSDDQETVGVVLPLRDPIPEKLAKLLTTRKMGRIHKHYKKHPEIKFMLFVGRPEDGKKEAVLIEEIWRELRRLKGFVKRHYLKLLH